MQSISTIIYQGKNLKGQKLKFKQFKHYLHDTVYTVQALFLALFCNWSYQEPGSLIFKSASIVLFQYAHPNDCTQCGILFLLYNWHLCQRHAFTLLYSPLAPPPNGMCMQHVYKRLHFNSYLQTCLSLQCVWTLASK